MAQITYTDKNKTASDGIANKWRDVDANEVKSVINQNATAQAAHEADTSNPHSVTKLQVGLSNVDNTSDADKPVSTAQATANALKMDKSITANRQVASYTLVLGDAGKLIEMNNASANNLTVPLNSSVAFPIGAQILIAQYGAGQTTIVATGGVTIRSASGKLKLTGQYSAATLLKIAADEWYLFGDLTA